MKKPFRNPITKADKIKLLMDLHNGKIMIEELMPTEYKLWRLKEGLYYGPKDTVLTKDEFMARNEPGVKDILVVRTSNRNQTEAI